MKATLLLVGKTTDMHLSALIDEYVHRLVHYIPFSVMVLPELKQTKHLSVDQQKQQEGEMILRAIPSSADMILLDERGKMYSSMEFADYMQRRMSSGKDVVFVIGGPYGFSEAVYHRAAGMVSLSRMTFSHQMIRLLMVEQVYRAMTILHGEPYHHE